MVEFLVKRPVASLLSFLVAVILGSLSLFRIPVSLMPQIPVPEIRILFSAPAYSATELENTVAAPLRNQLQQLAHLQNLESRVRDGLLRINLRFDYNSSISYAYIETNEKIDAAMNYLPDDVQRPQVVKASSSDIPVLKLSISRSDTSRFNFLELSRFTEEVIRRRIEQLPDVAMADISGMQHPQISVVPHSQKLQAMGISQEQIRASIRKHNLQLSSLQINDGIYQYYLKLGGNLTSLSAIENIVLKTAGRDVRLRQIADIKLENRIEQGLFLANGQRAINLHIIKQADAQMHKMQESLYVLINDMQQKYPGLNITISQDQTRLLRFSINNLVQTLLIGSLLAFVISFLFMRNRRLPLLIGISIPISLIISILFFNLWNISINIISLSGLILGVGMMIDNAIIVVDNLEQHQLAGKTPLNAAIDGTNELIRPLLTSVITTSVIFLPLIFLSGMAGALFYDQAMAVTISLFSSLVVAVLLVPVLYNLLAGANLTVRNTKIDRVTSDFYEKTHHAVLQKKRWFLILTALVSILAATSYFGLKTSQMPQINNSDFVVYINWNEPVSLSENTNRIQHIIGQLKMDKFDYNYHAGKQDYWLVGMENFTPSEGELYVKAQSPKESEVLRQQIEELIYRQYPQSIITSGETQSVFTQLFGSNQADLQIELRKVNSNIQPKLNEISDLVGHLNQLQIGDSLKVPATRQQIVLYPDFEKLLLYKIELQVFNSTLSTLFRSNSIDYLRGTSENIPIVMKENPENLYQLLTQNFVSNADGINYPLNALLRVIYEDDFTELTAGLDGLYVALPLENAPKIEQLRQQLNSFFTKNADFQYKLTGNYFASKALMQELLYILGISLLLLYFFLAIQFESLLLPFIILIELPVDIAFALLFLYLSGFTLNLMSGVGIIVMSGIIINDSILKIAAIRQAETYLPLEEAIQLGGKQRLNSIIMTSLTTIIALLPFFVSSGLGSDLQRPFAIVLIGGLAVGTIVSIYLIPVLYFYFQNGKTLQQTKQKATGF